MLLPTEKLYRLNSGSHMQTHIYNPSRQMRFRATYLASRMAVQEYAIIEPAVHVLEAQK